MTSLITVYQANDHQRLDLTADGNSPESYSQDVRTPEVLRKMDEATDIVLDYIQSYVSRLETPWTSDTVPPLVRAAVLMVFSWLWEHRGDDETTIAQANGYLTQPVTSLLHRYRDPAMA